MTDHAHDPDRCGEDVAAYALGSLEPAESDAFSRHLETCSVCQYELASFRQIVGNLAVSPPRYAASPALRRRVMRAVADEPRAVSAPGRVARRSRWMSLRVPRPAFAVSGLAGVAAAAVVVVVLATGGSGTRTRTIDAEVTGHHGTAALRVSSDGHAQLVVHDFPAAPSGEIYEVWLQHGSTYTPTTALFGVTSSGDANVDVPGRLAGASHVLVTVEPAGGTKVPTHPPVISADLT